MNYVGSKDFLEVIGESIISNVDIDVLSRLYQPIIGYKASMLYLTLVNYINYQEGEVITHENIFKLMQIDPGDFLNARKALEACGLMKSYLKLDNDTKYYTYVIYAPKSPKDFFTDVLFKGMLVKYVGEKEATKLALHYKVEVDLKGSKDISANFVEVFQPDLDDASFDAKMPTNLKDTKAIKVDTEFSFEDFFTHLKTAMMIREDAFSKEECDEIERIATLYGLDTITTCDIVAQSYDESKKKGFRLDMVALNERAMMQSKYAIIERKNRRNETFIRSSGRTAVANEIDLMSKLSPRLFLELKQDGVPAATSDLSILNYLSQHMDLNNETINALIDYCLKACNNRLNRSYIEKVATSLKRAKVNNAIDAMSYFNKRREKFHKMNSYTQKAEENTKKEEVKTNDEEEFAKLLKVIGKKK